MDAQQNDFKQEEAYKRAIDGFQFQISRYNTWMNYYAIFVGALFVAFYKVFPTGKEADWFLPVTIAFLGWFTSLCWYASLLGNSTWANNWMSAIKEIESSNWNVVQKPYSYLIPDAGSASPVYRKKFISTQKTTAAFIGAVCWAWAAAIGYLSAVWFGDGKLCWASLLVGIAGGIIVTGFWQWALNKWKCRFWSSSL